MLVVLFVSQCVRMITIIIIIIVSSSIRSRIIIIVICYQSVRLIATPFLQDIGTTQYIFFFVSMLGSHTFYEWQGKVIKLYRLTMIVCTVKVFYHKQTHPYLHLR